MFSGDDILHATNLTLECTKIYRYFFFLGYVNETVINAVLFLKGIYLFFFFKFLTSLNLQRNFFFGENDFEKYSVLHYGNKIPLFFLIWF